MHVWTTKKEAADSSEIKEVLHLTVNGTNLQTLAMITSNVT